jgi:hypothetical protein
MRAHSFEVRPLLDRQRTILNKVKARIDEATKGEEIIADWLTREVWLSK